MPCITMGNQKLMKTVDCLQSHVFRSTWRVWTPLSWFPMNERNTGRGQKPLPWGQVLSPVFGSHFFLFFFWQIRSWNQIIFLFIYLFTYLLLICLFTLFLYLILHIFLIVYLLSILCKECHKWPLTSCSVAMLQSWTKVLGQICTFGAFAYTPGANTTSPA